MPGVAAHPSTPCGANKSWWSALLKSLFSLPAVFVVDGDSLDVSTLLPSGTDTTRTADQRAKTGAGAAHRTPLVDDEDADADTKSTEAAAATDTSSASAPLRFTIDAPRLRPGGFVAPLSAARTLLLLCIGAATLSGAHGLTSVPGWTPSNLGASCTQTCNQKKLGTKKMVCSNERLRAVNGSASAKYLWERVASGSGLASSGELATQCPTMLPANDTDGSRGPFRTDDACYWNVDSTTSSTPCALPAPEPTPDVSSKMLCCCVPDENTPDYAGITWSTNPGDLKKYCPLENNDCPPGLRFTPAQANIAPQCVKALTAGGWVLGGTGMSNELYVGGSHLAYRTRADAIAPIRAIDQSCNDVCQVDYDDRFECAKDRMLAVNSKSIAQEKLGFPTFCTSWDKTIAGTNVGLRVIAFWDSKWTKCYWSGNNDQDICTRGTADTLRRCCCSSIGASAALQKQECPLVIGDCPATFALQKDPSSKKLKCAICNISITPPTCGGLAANKACLPGSYLSNTTFECTACPAGRVGQGYGTTCEDTCAAGQYGGTGSYPCVGCQYGKWSNVSGRGTNDYCPYLSAPGRYTITPRGYPNCASQFMSCPKGEPYISPRATAIAGTSAACKAGRWSSTPGLVAGWSNSGSSLNKGSCPNKCSAGKWSSATGLSTDSGCTPVAQGHWSSVTGLYALPSFAIVNPTTAGFCLPGRWSNRTGLSSADDCTLCPAGRFSSRYAAIVCESVCPAGMWSNRRGLTVGSNCTGCSAGRFASMEGARTSDAECTKCSVGFLSSALTTGATACAACAEGRTSGAAATVCVGCSPGRFINASGLCGDCSPGFYSGDVSLGATACARCVAGRTSDAGAPNCTKLVTCPPLLPIISSRGVGLVQKKAVSPAEGPMTLIASERSAEVNDGVPRASIAPPSESERSNFGDIFSLNCNDGSPVNGPKSIACSDDGTWRPDPLEFASRCDVVACPSLNLEVTVAFFNRDDFDTSSSAMGNKGGFNGSSGSGSNTSKSIIYTGCAAETGCAGELSGAVAPAKYKITCARTARTLYFLGKGSDIKVEVIDRDDPLYVKCETTGLWNYSFDIRNIRCQCVQGERKGTGEQAAECLTCSDGTFAPINKRLERDECRACPRVGVNCNDGILQILPDFWYDTTKTDGVYKRCSQSERQLEGCTDGFREYFDGEGKTGVRTYTGIYPCVARRACLVNRDRVPMTMYCAENQTGVLCSRCYDRHVSCGRSEGPQQDPSCVAPGYFARGEEWMYFAPLARHCERCPYGNASWANIGVTVAFVFVFVGALMGLVAHRLSSVWKRLTGKHRSDSSGIARVLFNWIQLISMLQAVKLQPPEEVADAMETAEVANVSLEWFPIQCTLRLTFFTRVTIYMFLPMVAVLLPLMFVLTLWICTPIARASVARAEDKKRRGRRLTPCDKFFLKNATKLLPRQRTAYEDDEDELDFLDELASAAPEEKLTAVSVRKQELTRLEEENEWLWREYESTISHRAGADGDAPVPPSALGDEKIAAPYSSPSRTMQVQRCFKIVTQHPIALRSIPSNVSDVMDLVVRPGDVISTFGPGTRDEEGRLYHELSGPWGNGWVFATLPGDNAVATLFELDPAKVVNPGVPIDAHHRDDVQHCFNAISAIDLSFIEDQSTVPEGWWTSRGVLLGGLVQHPRRGAGTVVAISPEDDDRVHIKFLRGGDLHRYYEHSWGKIESATRSTISLEVLEHILPAAWTPNEVQGLVDKWGTAPENVISFAHFMRMHDELRSVWRFEEVWRQFSSVDISGDGALQIEEIAQLVPKGASNEELHRWMARFDKKGLGYITFADFPAFDRALRLDKAMLAVGTSFVLCVYFVYSRVTKAVLFIFAYERIDGVPYMKREMGTAAFTERHWVMMGISVVYLLFFSVLTPVAAIYAMFHVRKKTKSDRRVATILGFFTDGYRDEVSWFWEFIVLIRKIAILSVSLFIPDAFLQSFTAIVVLIVSICMQLHVRPFEMESLNILELGALLTLLLNQLAGILIWYIQQYRIAYLQFAQFVAVVIIFTAYFIVILAFVFVMGLAWIKHKSKPIAQWFPNAMLPLFDRLVAAEAWWFDRLFVEKDAAFGAAKSASRRAAWTYLVVVDQGGDFDRGPGGKARSKCRKFCRKFWRRCSCLVPLCPALPAIFIDEEYLQEAAADDARRASMRLQGAGRGFGANPLEQDTSDSSRSPRSRPSSVESTSRVASNRLSSSSLQSVGSARSASSTDGDATQRCTTARDTMNPMQRARDAQRASQAIDDVFAASQPEDGAPRRRRRSSAVDYARASIGRRQSADDRSAEVRAASMHAAAAWSAADGGEEESDPLSGVRVCSVTL